MDQKDKKVSESNPTLAEIVFQELRRDILMGVYRPSQKLLLHELKVRYDTGGSPIREALLKLTWYRYVVMKPQRGFWVAPVSLHELNDILLLRRMIAGEAVKRSLERGEETWELAMLTCYHRFSRFSVNDQDVDSPFYHQWLSVAGDSKFDDFPVQPAGALPTHLARSSVTRFTTLQRRRRASSYSPGGTRQRYRVDAGIAG